MRTDALDEGADYSALACALNHPDLLHPYMTLFNQRAIESLVEKGTELDVVSPRPFAPPIGPYSSYSRIPMVESWGGYDLYHPRILYLLPRRYFYGLTGQSYAKRVPRFIERRLDVPDLVQAYSVFPDGYGMLSFCEKHDRPLFVFAHGIVLGESFDLPKYPRNLRRKIRRTLEECTGILCVSEVLAARISEFVPEEKVRAVPIGADPRKFPVDRREEIRAELGIPADTTVVLFVGEFSARKGLRELIEILPELDLASTEFVFVGHGGGLRRELRQAVARSQFSTRHLYWQITSIALRRLFAIADLLLLPSHSEGRPTVIYEAMASKTAVLASNVDGIPEQVVDGETGVLIPPGDPAVLKASLESLVGDRDALLEMGERGYQRLLEQGWTWDEHARRVQAIHRAAIE